MLLTTEFPLVQTSPKLDTPKYVVLKKTKDYEIRNYQPFLAAEVTMPADAKATSGDGFEDLSNYIFGGNRRYCPATELNTCKPRNKAPDSNTF